jgi:hypothetical protein
MKAITTKYLSATATKPARVQARCDGGHVTLSWDDGVSAEDNHLFAAQNLAERMGWGRVQFAQGQSYDGRYQHVLLPESRDKLRARRATLAVINGKESVPVKVRSLRALINRFGQHVLHLPEFCEWAHANRTEIMESDERVTTTS